MGVQPFSTAAADAELSQNAKFIFRRGLDCGHEAATSPSTTGAAPPPVGGTAYCWECGQTRQVVTRTRVQGPGARKGTTRRKTKTV